MPWAQAMAHEDDKGAAIARFCDGRSYRLLRLCPQVQQLL
jgi:hypothetical protein